jgi:DNA segregation ATPase FtsK/SpoIIIE, S-DNA-T family
MLVYGASGAGKTVVLHALARALATGATPREVQLYGLDFASGALRAIEALPHCGSVVGGDDQDLVLRLLRRFARALAERKRRAAAGEDVGSRLVLLLDGYGAFAATMERVDYGEPVQLVTRLAAEGRALRIHVVATADRRGEVPGALTGVAPMRLVLRMADADELLALGVPRSAAGAELPPGRGFLAEGLEFQVGLPGDLAAFGAAQRERCRGKRAPAVRTLPERVERGALPAPSAPLQAIVGLDDELLAPSVVDLGDSGLLVAGPHRSGRTTALATLASSLRAGASGLALHLLAPRRTPLADLDVWSTTAVGAEEVAASAARLAADGGAPMVVFVDDATELDAVSVDASLSALVRRGREAGVRLVAAVETQAALRTYGGWLSELRAEGHGLLLAPSGELDGDLLGVRLPRPTRDPIPGRGFLVKGGVARLVQVAGD